MINTQKVTNHVSDKLKLIKLGSLDNFIDTYLKQTITFVAKCVREQKEYLIYDKFSYIIGFNINEKLALICNETDYANNTTDNANFILAGDNQLIKITDNYGQMAQDILTNYYQYHSQLKLKQQSWTGQQINWYLNENKLRLNLDFVTTDFLFTPKTYIDYLLGQCKLPLSQTATAIFDTACYKYIAVEGQYFYTQVLANANLKAMIANYNFARLIFQVIKQDNSGKTNYKLLALLSLLKERYNLQQLVA